MSGEGSLPAAGSFANHPLSLSEARADRSGRLDDLTPRDALIRVLRDLDVGAIQADHVIIALGKTLAPGASRTLVYQGRPLRFSRPARPGYPRGHHPAGEGVAMFRLSRGVTLGIAGAILLLVLLFAGPAACNKIRSLGAQARLQGEQIDSLGNSAKDAIATQGAANVRERESEDLTKTNDEEIRNAEGASEKVNPAVRDAGRRSLCRRASYRDKPECRGLFGPRPAGVEGGR